MICSACSYRRHYRSYYGWLTERVRMELVGGLLPWRRRVYNLLHFCLIISNLSLIRRERRRCHWKKKKKMKKRQIIGEAAAKSEFDEPPTATISATVRQRPDRNIKDYILKIGPSFFFLWIDYIANLFFFVWFMPVLTGIQIYDDDDTWIIKSRLLQLLLFFLHFNFFFWIFPSEFLHLKKLFIKEFRDERGKRNVIRLSLRALVSYFSVDDVEFRRPFF